MNTTVRLVENVNDHIIYCATRAGVRMLNLLFTKRLKVTGVLMQRRRSF